MKTLLILLAGMVLLAACSAPKYTYYFDHYDYNSGKKKANTENTMLADATTATADALPILAEESPLILEKETIVASTENEVQAPLNVTPVVEKTALQKKYTDMTKHERKEFKKELKTEIKKYAKVIKSGDSGAALADTKAMDYNLKMAIIFGAVALTLSFFGGVNSVFWILSVVSLVVGVVFFIKWIAEQ